MPQRKYMFGYHFLARLREAGLIDETAKRVVIDARHDDYPVMYVQQAVDEQVLEVLLAETDLTVKVVEAPGGD